MQKVLDKRLTAVDKARDPSSVMDLFHEHPDLVEKLPTGEHGGTNMQDLYRKSLGKRPDGTVDDSIDKTAAQDQFITDVANLDPKDLTSWMGSLPLVGKMFSHKDATEVVQAARRYSQLKGGAPDPLEAELPHLIHEMGPDVARQIAGDIRNRNSDPKLSAEQRATNEAHAKKIEDYAKNNASGELNYGDKNMFNDVQNRTSAANIYHNEMNNDFEEGWTAKVSDAFSRFIDPVLGQIDLSQVADKAVQGAIGAAKQSRQEIDSEMRNRVSRAQGMINQLIQLMGMSRQF